MTLGYIGDVVDLVRTAQARGVGAVVVSVVGNRSALPVPLGARMLILESGERHGVVHARLDDQLAADALQCMQTRKSAMRSYDVETDALRHVGTQGGTFDAFFEVLSRPIRLVIVGAGHIAVHLCPVAVLLGYRVTILDDRPEYASRERFPAAFDIAVGPYRQTLASLSIDRDTCVVLVTRGHVHDRACLQLLAGSEARYIGMIGSKRRVRTVFDQMVSAGYDEAFLRDVHAPVGLDIGAETPAEIAVAIAAEIVQVLRSGVKTSRRQSASSRV